MKNLLKKWLGGTATWEAEKHLRRAAEQDDFLAEAIEGYDAFPTSDHTATIGRLKSRLPRQATQQKGLIFYMGRVAAAAAIIGVIGTFIWIQQEVQQPAILSQNAEKLALPEPKSEEIATITPTEESIDNQSVEQNKSNQNTSKKDKIPTPAPAKPIAKKSQPKQSNQPIKTTPIVSEPAPATYADNTPDEEAFQDAVSKESEAIIAETPVVSPQPENLSATSTSSATYAKEEMPPVAANENAATPAAATENVPESTIAAAPLANNQAFAKKSMPTPEPKARKAETVKKVNYYAGAVKNEDGQPLNKVKIIGLDTPFKTETELNGDFLLQSDMPLTIITVSRDGFHTRKISINQYTDYLNVVLVKKSTTVENDVAMETMAPKPDGGLVKFYEYLKNNLQYPANAKARGIEREVEIKFFIDETGTPTNLKVTNPDVYGFQEEAKRLLENGPKWQPLNSHAKYYVSFEL